MRRAYQGVTGFVGMPGSGKTYSLVEIAVRAMRGGRNVWANFTIDGEGLEGDFHRIHDIEELIVVPNGTTVLIDELQNMFNARAWQDFPHGFLYRLTQVRKDGLSLYYSTQHEEYVDVTVRRITSQFWHCRPLLGRLFVRSLWAPESFRKQSEKPRRREYVRVKLDTAARYDTNEKVAIRRSWLLKVLELSEDPFIEVPNGVTMRELLDIARLEAEAERAAKAEARSSRRALARGVPGAQPPGIVALPDGNGTGSRQEGGPRPTGRGPLDGVNPSVGVE